SLGMCHDATVMHLASRLSNPGLGLFHLVDRIDLKGEVVQTRPILGEATRTLLPEREYDAGAGSQKGEGLFGIARFSQHLKPEYVLIEPSGPGQVAHVETNVTSLECSGGSSHPILSFQRSWFITGKDASRG